jgi:hypothetical protein
MKFISEKRIIAFNFLALCLLLSPLLSCFFSDFIKRQNPSDELLISNFNAHKAEFGELLKMFQEDKQLGRVSDFTRSENPESININQERIAQYRQIFKKLGLTAGIEGYQGKELIWFHASSQGLSVTGSSKGYVYAINKPEKVVDNLDNYKSEDGKSFTAFRQIEDNWYLYLDYED